MAYCESCGAYVPDGQTKCLACGFDYARPGGSRAAAAEAKRAAAQVKREEAEKRRAERREQERRAAEEEYARRRQTRQTDFTGRERPYSAPDKTERRVISLLSYFSILFILPFILRPGDEFARFHGKQGLALFVFGILADLIGAIFPIGWVLTLFRIFCVYKGVTNCLAGRMTPLPYIGKFALR